MAPTPINQIKKNLSGNLSINHLNKLPSKWEKIGNVLIISLPSDLLKFKTEIGETYSKILECKTVLNDIGGISGILRKPKREIVYGSSDTITVHKENGVLFKLDPMKVMFSSGNIDERIRMANISNKNETVVDLFAGIGYFSLPMAVYCKPKKIFSCELNPTSYKFLCENIVLNNVSDIIEPIKGDCRVTAPKNIADRVLLGYIFDTKDYLPTAFECLKDNTGIIHYHNKFPDKKVPNIALKDVEAVSKKYSCKYKLLEYRLVKSYAPGISHYVFDFGIDKK